MRPAPTKHMFQARHARLAYHDWAGEPGAPAVFLVHATGFHARVWDQIILKLPESWRVIALDSRGHGQSPDCEPLNDWLEGAGDTIDLIGRSGHPIHGGGRGTPWAAMLLPQRRLSGPDAFGSMVLVDPVLLSPTALETDRMGSIKTIADHPVARRRNGWVDWQAFHAEFSQRLPYSRWQPQILEDYCRHGVQPQPLWRRRTAGLSADGGGLRLFQQPVGKPDGRAAGRPSADHGPARQTHPLHARRAVRLHELPPPGMDWRYTWAMRPTCTCHTYRISSRWRTRIWWSGT